METTEQAVYAEHTGRTPRQYSDAALIVGRRGGQEPHFGVDRRYLAVTDLEPDDDVMFRFLQTWFSPCNHCVVELGWTDERNGKLTLFRRFALDDMAAAARFAVETNARAGASMYFRPATTDDDVVQNPRLLG